MTEPSLTPEPHRPGARYATKGLERARRRARERAREAITSETRANRNWLSLSFRRWGLEMGLDPDHPTGRDVLCYIHDHVRGAEKPWSHSHAKGVQLAIRSALSLAAQDDPTVTDPTDDPELDRYLRALKRSERLREPVGVSDPVLDIDIEAMAALESVRQRGAGEIIQRRDEAALLLSRAFEVRTRQLMRVRRCHVTIVDPAEIQVVLPETRGGGAGLTERTAVIRHGDAPRLHASLSRLLELLDAHRAAVDDAVFNLLDARGAKPLRTGTPAQCGPALRRHWELAAGRAGLDVAMGDPVALDGLDLEWLCDNLNPNLLHDLRDLVLVVVAQDRDRRHAEMRHMRRSDVYPPPGQPMRPDESFVWTIPQQKNRDDPQTLEIAHLEGCPPHCPACLFGEWLELNDFAGDDLVFQGMRSGGRKTGLPVLSVATTNGIRRMAAGAGVDGEFSAKSCRCGGVTSGILGGESLDEAAATAGHADRNITYRHYFRPQRLLRAAATRRSAVAVHQIGAAPPAAA